MKFENELNKITGRTTTMGIEELLLAQARHEGEVKGEKKGEAKGKSIGEAIGESKRALLFVRSLIRDTDFNDKKIASLADVTIAFVAKTRAELSVV